MKTAATEYVRCRPRGACPAVDFQEGVDPPSPLRRRYSFYVQAVK